MSLFGQILFSKSRHLFGKATSSMEANKKKIASGGNHMGASIHITAYVNNIRVLCQGRSVPLPHC